MATTPTGVGTTAFKGLKTPRSVLQYNLMHGVTDFSNLEQYDLYEKGYPWLVVLKVPQFMTDLAEEDNEIEIIVNNFVHILENDFRGIDNIDNITGEANGEITNGIRSIQLINKTVQPSNSSFTMRYYERSGSVLTKFIELYLTGIKDKDTQAKTYHGLIDNWVFKNIDSTSGKDPGPHQEVFAFMYFLTDNTVTKIEKAFLICAAQPTTAEFSNLYAGDKGDIGWGELNMTFNGFFINNDAVSQAAYKMLLAMRSPENVTGTKLIVDSTNFAYDVINDIEFNDNNAQSWATEDGVLREDYRTNAASGFTGSANKPLESTSNGTDDTNDGEYVKTVKIMKGQEHLINGTESDSSGT